MAIVRKKAARKKAAAKKVEEIEPEVVTVPVTVTTAMRKIGKKEARRLAGGDKRKARELMTAAGAGGDAA